MMTPDEKSDPKNAEIAARVLYWHDSDTGEVRVHAKKVFIKLDMESLPGRWETFKQNIFINYRLS